MEVILLERINRLGALGDIVKVRDGYARNFLIPMKKALRANNENKKVFEERRHVIEQQNAEGKQAAQAEAKKLEGASLTIIRQASQEGKLYGSITVRDVADTLNDAGFSIPKSQIILTSAIKTTGEYTIRLNLHAEVTAEVKLTVARVESDAA